MNFPTIEPLEARIAPATLSIADAQITEGDAGRSTLTFTVTLSAADTTTVSVDFLTGLAADAAKSSGAFPDYELKQGQLSFSPGQTVRTMAVPIVGDLVGETDETFTVKLSNPVNATLADDTALGTIRNGADTKIGLALQDTRTVEGAVTKTLSLQPVLSSPATSAVTFTIGVQNGTAIAGSDFNGTTQTFTIPAGQTQAATGYSVSILGDRAFEPTESFFVNLSGAPADLAVVSQHRINPAVQASARVYLYNDDTQNLGPRTAQWIDVDGDLVTLTVSKGSLPLDNPTLLTFDDAASTVGGRQLERLNLGAFSGSFAGTSVTITATKQAGFPDATDGRVDVGFIQAARFIPQELQVIGVDLGTVTVDGDLAKIAAGDQFSTAAISKLDVYSLGVNPATLSTLSSDLRNTQSDVLGPVTTVNVKTDVAGYLHVVGAEFGTLGSLNVAGALKGGTETNSGRVTASGKISRASIGSIVGGAGDNSGVLSGTPETSGTLGTVTVLGDIVGGSGASSGAIFSGGNLTSVTVRGDVQGGTGTGSGGIGATGTIDKVVIGKSVIGGNSNATDFLSQSGFVSAIRLKSVTVAGDLRAGKDGGGGIANTGSIRADVIDAVAIRGNVLGDDTGTTASAATIAASGLRSDLAIKTVTIGGNVDLAEILAGYDDTTTKTNVRGTAISGDASIGSVTIEGTARELNIVAGGQLGTDTRFGTANNKVIPAVAGTSNNEFVVISTIASVVIKGGLAAEVNPDFYGIVAQSIGTIKIGATTIPLQAGAFNDRPPKDLGSDATFKFRAVELAVQ